MKNTVNEVKKNLSELDYLLGENNVEDIKKRIGDLIVSRIASDLRAYDYYLFYPEDYTETINSAFEKIEKKIIKMYSDALLETATESVTRFKDIALSHINETQGLQLRSCHKCEHCNSNRCRFYDDYYWKAHDKICAEEGFINFKEKVD